MARRIRMVTYLKQFELEMRAEMLKRMDAIGQEVSGQVKQNLSIPTATAGPSVPGEIPHLVSGLLRESIYSETTQAPESISTSTIIATDVKAPEDGRFPYGWYLELSNGDRPFLRPTVFNMIGRIVQMFHKRRGKRTQSTVVFK